MISAHEPSWDQAREFAATSAQPLSKETVRISASLDRITSQDVFALCDLPTYTTSAMDGFALCGNGPWKIIGEVKAGAPSTEIVLPGEAMRIATGAVIPDGVDSVVEWESAKVVNEYVHASPKFGAHIRPAGAECKVNELLIPQGTKITPAIMGFLSAAGHDEIDVKRKPRIALLLLGDELLTQGLPSEGRVRDALGPQLPSWLTRLGAEVVSQEYVPDELEAVTAAIFHASANCDIIISTGGTADGPRDHVHAALAQLSVRFIVDRVRSRPGHPMLLAELHKENHPPTLFLGLPGNPQSAIVGLLTLGQSVIDAMLGKEFCELSAVITRSELQAPTDFNRLVLGNLIDGEFHAGQFLGSAMLRSLALSDGFAIAPSGVTAPGSLVRWLPLP